MGLIGWEKFSVWEEFSQWSCGTRSGNRPWWVGIHGMVLAVYIGCPCAFQEAPFFRSARRSAGFTLIEVTIALAILVVIALIGWSSFQDSLPRYHMISTAKRLRGDLMNVRNLAIQTGHEARLRLTSVPAVCASDREIWGGSWELALGDRSARSQSWDVLPVDAADDGTDDNQSEGLVDIGRDGNAQARWVCLDDWGTIQGPATDNADAIVFSPRGWVLNPGGDFGSSGYMEITLVNQIAGRDGVTDEVTLHVSRAGMVRLTPTLSGTDAGSAGSGMGSSL